MEGVVDGLEEVDELSHAMQCATLAIKAGAEPELAAAALLHDVARAPSVRSAYPGWSHERAGAAWAGARGYPRVAWLIAAHVPAKLWLVDNDHTYRQSLSEESLLSLQHQNGADVATWSAHSWWPEAVQLRRWDDGAKIPGAAVLSWPEVFSAMQPRPRG